MSVVVANLIQGASVSVGSDGSVSVTKSYLVSEYTGPPETVLEDVIFEPGIPAFGDPHPSTNFTAFVTTKSARAAEDDPRIFIVEVTYSQATAVAPPGSDALITLEANLNTKETNQDVAGDDMFVEWRPMPPQTGPPQDYIAHGVLASVQKPQVVAKFSKKFIGIPPFTMIGKLNSGSFFGDPAKTWLCTSIVATSTDNMQTFDVDYSFQRDDNSWKFTAVFIDPGSGEPPGENIEAGKGVKDFDMYNVASFAVLGLGV